MQRGETYCIINKYKESLVDLSLSLEIEPNNANALSIRGEVYFSMEKYKEALIDLNKSLEIRCKDTKHAWYCIKKI